MCLPLNSNDAVTDDDEGQAENAVSYLHYIGEE